MKEDYKDSFDFPCSYSFRSYEAYINEGIRLPCIDVPEEEAKTYQETEWSRRQWDVIEQLRAEVVGWRKKHAEALKEIDSLKTLLSRKKGYKY